MYLQAFASYADLVAIWNGQIVIDEGIEASVAQHIEHAEEIAHALFRLQHAAHELQQQYLSASLLNPIPLRALYAVIRQTEAALAFHADAVRQVLAAQQLSVNLTRAAEPRLVTLGAKHYSSKAGNDLFPRRWRPSMRSERSRT